MNNDTDTITIRREDWKAMLSALTRADLLAIVAEVNAEFAEPWNRNLILAEVERFRTAREATWRR